VNPASQTLAACVTGAISQIGDWVVFGINVTHRLIKRLELFITLELATFIRSLEKNPRRFPL
jgi:hypothetical protein